MQSDLQKFLEEKYIQFNQSGFIEDDPVCIPHLFTRKHDIEIAGFFAAILAWGQRKTIINKSKELIQMMDNDPHQFILHHSESNLKPFENFKHRTFSATDALYFIHFLKHIYLTYNSLEDVIIENMGSNDKNIEQGLVGLRKLFISLPDYPKRTGKHIASPDKKSACKRLNMYLRWMVRKDNKGVDFGIWNRIKPSQLVCPLDVHVERVARGFGLIKRKQNDWQTALELTNNLRKFDPIDPVKYDFALFGIGIEAKNPLI